MKKKLNMPALVSKLDTLFQTWVRLRHADEGGTVQCVTCGKLMFWKGDGATAGHFVKRGHRATRWEPTNCHVQCVSCNKFRDGMQDEYSKFIIETYGLAEFNRLMDLKHTTKKYTRSDLESMIETYRGKLAALEQREAA